jgi:hypothetical protein
MKDSYRSLFWPVILIGIGLLLLLANLGLLPELSLAYLLRFWPLILIVIGLDMLIGRRSALIGGLIGLAAVGLVALGLLFGQSLGIQPTQQGKTEQFQTPVGQATAADINLDLSIQPVELRALPASSDQLLDASIGHYGEMDFKVSGAERKSVLLAQSSISITGDLSWIGADNSLRWEIGLTPAVPLDLSINASTGSSTLDLSGLNLTSFKLDASTGSCNLTLPASAAAYEGSIESSTGSMNISLPAGTNLTLHIDGSTGSLNFSLPANAALRVEVRNSGTGSVNLPSNLAKLSGEEKKEGVWESAGFAQANARITLIFDDLSTGSLNIH